MLENHLSFLRLELEMVRREANGTRSPCFPACVLYCMYNIIINCTAMHKFLISLQLWIAHQDTFLKTMQVLTIFACRIDITPSVTLQPPILLDWDLSYVLAKEEAVCATSATLYQQHSCVLYLYVSALRYYTLLHMFQASLSIQCWVSKSCTSWLLWFQEHPKKKTMCCKFIPSRT